MNSSDLRIGNYVLTDDNIICQVSKIETKEYTKWNSGEEVSIICKQINTKDLYLECDNDNWQPIELTEELLLKCGFQKLGKYTFVCDTALMQLEIGVITNKLLHSILAIEVKHVHQLQNLYYALCNEELNVEL